MTIVLGTAMIFLGLTRGAWQGLIKGFVNFSNALRGSPPKIEPNEHHEREPILALLGLAVILFAIWAYLAA